MISSVKALNLACGRSKIAGAVNVDSSFDVGADKVFDIREPFPLDNDSFDEIYLFHAIEHIEKRTHPFVLSEIRRVLKEDGIVYISYPEFSTILKYWLDNVRGDREFWEACIYGRQAYKGDYHVSAIDTPEFGETLRQAGFVIKSAAAEPSQEFNTVIQIQKSPIPITYEELIYNEVFTNGSPVS